MDKLTKLGLFALYADVQANLKRAYRCYPLENDSAIDHLLTAIRHVGDLQNSLHLDLETIEKITLRETA